MGERSRLSYVVSQEAWYRSVLAHDMPEVMVHREALTDDGHHDGVHWEFGIRWHNLGGKGLIPRVEMFEDAWSAYSEVPDLFARLAEMANQHPTLDKVVRMLDRIGFYDATERVQPIRQSLR